MAALIFHDDCRHVLLSEDQAVVSQAMKSWTVIPVKPVAYFLSGVGLERDS